MSLQRWLKILKTISRIRGVTSLDGEDDLGRVNYDGYYNGE